jgi:hypothetical protein
MNPSDSESHPATTPQDRLTDALLREHARLGSLDDEGLLATIRARTVARPSSVTDFPAPSQRPRTTTREWMQIAAIVALSLTVLGLFLSQRRVAQETRAGKMHQLVSHPKADVTATVRVEPDTADSPSLAKTHPGVVSPPDVRALTLAEFSVSAESTFQLAPGRLIYEGDVVLHHPDFTLKADRLELTSTDGADNAPVETFVARGEGIEIEKRSANGSIEIARASQATYDSDGGRLILAGGATLSAGNSFVQPLTTAGVIILRADGYEVIER